MSPKHSRFLYVLMATFFATLITGCASLEKRVDLTYPEVAQGKEGAGGVFLARPVFDEPPATAPGGRVILGSVKGTDTWIVTPDDVPRWVRGALGRELSAVGYRVETGPVLTARVERGVLVRVHHLSSNQESDGLVLTTSTDIALIAEVRRHGRLVKTLTASAQSQDQGLDRSDGPVSASLRKTLQSALRELVPGITNALEE
jgi:hypothetical protein